MSDFLTLDAIAKKNGKIKTFPIPNNLKSFRKSTKSEWGSVTIAVDTDSLVGLSLDEVIGILVLVDKEEWEKEKTLERGQE